MKQKKTKIPSNDDKRDRIITCSVIVIQAAVRVQGDASMWEAPS